MKDSKFKIQAPKKDEDVARIFLTGDLGVNKFKSVVDKISEAESKYENIEINIGEVIAFDLASLQLLISLKKTREKNNKKISFNIDLSKDLTDLLNITGFTNIIKSL
ncbi:MAG: hypothetical protein B6I20_08445 [Bacteroidetes bacterium 4572_117]|nr:MAG: hypothetical protein B6I20_08445 [Bacteroidetes bacterium 4572_117]